MNSSIDQRLPKILAVDDDPQVLHVLGNAFAPDFDLAVMTDSKQVLEFARQFQPDLILLDVMMPGLNGYDVCSQLKSDPLLAQLPVIFLTIRDDNQAQNTGFQVGAMDYIAKPFNNDILLHRVRNQLQVKFTLDELEKRIHDYRIAQQKNTDVYKAKMLFLEQKNQELSRSLQRIQSSLQQTLAWIDENRALHLLKKADHAIKHSIGLNREMLDLTQLETGQLALTQRPFTIRELMTRLQDVFSVLNQKPETQLLFNVDATVLQQTFIGDKNRLGQILINLSKYSLMRIQGGCLTVTIHFEQDESSRLHFQLQHDGGHRVSSESEAAYRCLDVGDGNYKVQSDPSLNLLTSQSLVKTMGGNLQCQNQADQGIEFCFSVIAPLERLNIDVENEADYGNQIRSQFAGCPVLVVDDDLFLQDLFIDLLEPTGLEISLASNGLQALEQAQKETFALILMDMQMPEMDGIDATAAIRKLPQYQNTPIIGLTGNTVDEDHQACLDAGMNELHIKPITYDVLCHTLYRWLNHS